MAFLKCLRSIPEPPAPQIPINTTFTNQYTSRRDTAISIPKQEIFSTKNVASLKVQVDWYIGAFAGLDDARWSRNCSECYFYVNGKQYLDTGRIEVQSANDGWVYRSGSPVFTITEADLPNGNCNFDYNLTVYFMWWRDNIGSSWQGFNTYVRFTVKEVTYK